MGKKASRKQEKRQRQYAEQQRRDALERRRAATLQLSAHLPAAPVPAAPPKPTPVFSECVVGYRMWKIDALGRLRPQSCDLAPWVLGINSARCERSRYGGGLFGGYILSGGVTYHGQQLDPPPAEEHDAPAQGCDCGLYARFTANEVWMNSYDLEKPDVYVVGSVAAWGNLQVHVDGMRAEKMCVTALAVPDDAPAEIRALIERVAAGYRVPVVVPGMLQAEAEMHGTPLPEEHRPERRESRGDLAWYGNSASLGGYASAFSTYITNNTTRVTNI